MRRASQALDGRLLAAVFLPPLALLVVLAVTAQVRELDTGAIFRDPVSLLDGYPLLGAMSNVGVLFWWMTTGICLFAWSLARRSGLERPVLVFLLSAGLLTMLLAIDDQFLLHDELLPMYLGLRERYIMAGYLVLVAGWLLLNLRVIRGSEWPLLVAALLFFAGSVATDAIAQATMSDITQLGQGLDWALFLEDGLKFVGIFGWSAYLIRYSHATIARNLLPAGERPSA